MTTKPGNRYASIDIKKLQPYPDNARTHSPEQIEKLARSIREFGFINPVLIDSNFGIIAGHGRVQAAQEEGLDTVPCLFIEHLTDEQKRAYILADNKLAEDAGWNRETLQRELFALNEMDFDITLTGFTMDDLEIVEPEIDFEEDDFDPDGSIPSVSKTGQVWQLGKHRLMCGDSTNQADVDKLVGGEEMDLCVTDPPYNVNYEGQDGLDPILNDNMSDESFYYFLKDFYSQMLRVLKPGGGFYIFHADSEGYNFRAALKAAGGDVRQCLIWVKNSLVLGRQDYQWKHEPCLYGWKEGAGHYFVDIRSRTTVIEDVSDLDNMSQEELKQLVLDMMEHQTTVLHEDKPKRNDIHPTMKPVRLCGRLIYNSSKAGDSVLDLFGGSGSTLIACEQLNRRAFLMEMDPQYVDATITRWETLTGGKAELIEG